MVKNTIIQTLLSDGTKQSTVMSDTQHQEAQSC